MVQANGSISDEATYIHIVEGYKQRGGESVVDARIQGQEHPDEHPDPRAGAPGSKGRSTRILGQEHLDPRS